MQIRGVVVLDQLGMVTGADRGAEQLFALRATELRGRHFRSLFMACPDFTDGEHAGARVKALLAHGATRLVCVSSSRVAGEGPQSFVLVVDGPSAAPSLPWSTDSESPRRTPLLTRVLAAVTQGETVAAAASAALQAFAEDGRFGRLQFFRYDTWQDELVALAAHDDAPVPEQEDARHRLASRAAFERRASAAVWEADTNVGTWFALPLEHKDVMYGVIVGHALEWGDKAELRELTQLAAQVAAFMHLLDAVECLEELTKHLHAQSRQLEEKNLALGAAVRHKAAFLRAMSHELRTPLNAVIGFAALLTDGAAGALSREQQQFAREIYDAGHRLLTRVNGVLELAAGDEGQEELHTQPISLSPLVTNAVATFKDEAARAGVVIQSSVDPDLPLVHGDARKFQAIVNGLVSNAVKFTPEGGSVEVGARASSEHAEIVVSDSGIGIDAKDLPRLFKPFEQLDDGVARRYGGAGLGLALVKRIAERYGGAVSVHSVHGEGSSFVVRFPLTRAAVLTDLRESPRRLRIVLFWDHAAGEPMASNLRAAGHTIELASDAQAAAQLVSSHPVDLFILSVNAVGSYGLQSMLLHLARVRPRGVPILVVAECDDACRAVVLDSVALVARPVDRDELLSLVRRAIKRPRRNGQPDGLPGSVLVASSDPRIVSALSDHLASEPLHVGLAYSGLHALTLLDTHVPDLLVLDLFMPDMDGLEVLAKLRSRAETHELPVVLLSPKTLRPDELSRLSSDLQVLFVHERPPPTDLCALVQRLA